MAAGLTSIFLKTGVGIVKERNGYETFQIRDVLVAVDLDESVLNTFTLLSFYVRTAEF